MARSTRSSKDFTQAALASLFDPIQRTDRGPALYAEPIFRYLNRSETTHAARIRATTESWYIRFPTSGKPSLRTRFRSLDDGQHQAAFFELFVHELLLSLDCRAIPHPRVPGTSRKPDYLVVPATGERFYLEATTTSTKSAAQTAAQARMNAVYDILDRVVDSRNFFLSVHIEGSPATQPPAKNIAVFLNARLAELDPDVITNLWNSSNSDGVPTWQFSHAGWQIEFRPIPKKREARGKPGARPIGSLSTGVQLVDHKTPIRETIMHKGRRYGRVNLPFIIAVNVLEAIDDTDVMQSLFGTEQWPILPPDPTSGDPHLGPMFRIPDGAWVGPHGPRYTRISAVLLVSRLSAYNIGQATARLYHHPWALRPIHTALPRLPQAVPTGNQMKYKEGEMIGAILGLPPRWPLDPL